MDNDKPATESENDKSDKFGWNAGDLESSRTIAPKLWAMMPEETKEHFIGMGWDAKGNAPEIEKNNN